MAATKRNRLLRELLIDDNVHSKIQSELWSGTGVEEGSAERVRRNRTRDNNRETAYEGVPAIQALHSSELESTTDINAMNRNVQFSEDRRIVTIRYNSLKYLQFDRVLGDSARQLSCSGSAANEKAGLDCLDFNVFESENLLTSLDNESQLPYRGAIANKQEASTSKTTPNVKDREFFLSLLQKSQQAAHFNGNTLLAFSNNDSSVLDKKRLKHSNSMYTAKMTNVEYIFFQNCEIKTWFKAPYPEEYNKNKILYVCDKCLKYMSSKYVYYRHGLKCDYTHPPGNQIYRDMEQGFAIWEVDGRENVIYCQNLCLLAKLFLNSKTLYYDVEPFLFYTITIWENNEWKFVGYFSKEKLNSTDYNLSCILTLPHYQRRGIGHLLMDFSYLLSRREYKLGTPEKPLSDLGLVSYRIFWKNKMIETLHILFEKFGTSFACSIDDLSNLTGMNHSDVVYGLEQIGCLYKFFDESMHKWRHVVKVQDWNSLHRAYERTHQKMKYTLDPSKLIWKPVIFGPSCGINAVGTMVETNVEQKRRTSVSGSSFSHDPFKQSISVLKNFMTDDLADPRSMEEIAMEKIVQQSESIFKENETLMQAYTLPKSVRDKIIQSDKALLQVKSPIKHISASPLSAVHPNLVSGNSNPSDHMVEEEAATEGENLDDGEAELGLDPEEDAEDNQDDSFASEDADDYADDEDEIDEEEIEGNNEERGLSDDSRTQSPSKVLRSLRQSTLEVTQSTIGPPVSHRILRNRVHDK